MQSEPTDIAPEAWPRGHAQPPINTPGSVELELSFGLDEYT